MTEKLGHKTIWTFVITSIALVMVTLDNLVVTTALPVIRHDLHATLEGLEWTVNAYTLTFAVLLLTGAALGDRFGRRRLFVLGLGDLHRRLRVRRARAEHRGAEHRPRASGCRRRDRDPAHPHAPERRRAGEPARARPRRVGRNRRPGGRARPARRRRGRIRHLLAMDLLAERSDRPPPHPACLAAPGGELRPELQARPARARPCQRRPARDRLGPGAGQQRRLGLAGDRRFARRRRSPRGALRPVGAAHRSADAADALLPQPDVHAGERRLAVHVLRDVRLDLPARAVLPDRAGLLALRFRPAHPALDGDADDRGADRRRALRPHLRPAHHGRRPRAAGDRARLDRGGLDADRSLRGAGRPVHPLRRGHGPLLRPGCERGPRKRPAARGGTGLGREQRHPRARRRLRRRGARLHLRELRRLRLERRASSTASSRRSGSARSSSASARSPRSPSRGAAARRSRRSSRRRLSKKRPRPRPTPLGAAEAPSGGRDGSPPSPSATAALGPRARPRRESRAPPPR